MARIIKRGKCDYRHIPAPDMIAGADNVMRDEHDAGFNSLSMFIQADAPDDSGDGEENGHGIQQGTNGMDAVESVSLQAEAMLKEARQEAADIMVQAREAMQDVRRRGEEIESQAYSQGFEQGKKDGEEMGRRQYQAVAQRLEKLLDGISSGAKALLPQYEAQMVKVIMAAATHIVEREIELSPDIVLESIRAAMEQVVEGSVVHLHLNPADIEALEEEIRKKFSVPGSAGLDIVNDPGIGRGGCLIETEYGLIDATTRARWQAVSDTINRILVERTGAVPAGDEPASMNADAVHGVSSNDRQERREDTV